jgi:hypothetical protein
MKSKQSNTGAWIAGGVAVAAVIAAGVYLARSGPQGVSQLPGASTGTPSAIAGPATPSESTPAIQHPIEQAAIGDAEPVSTEPLPELGASDSPAFDAIAAVTGGSEALGALISPEHLVQRIVASVDGLTRPQLGENVSPLRAAPGVFATRADGSTRVIATDNAGRYDAYARIAQGIDAKKLVGWYVHAYPLFQNAYRELGYPNAYFNDRLVAVIDHLLATPDPQQPLAVTRPNVLYEFADPALEARSAGQKALLRAGPRNEAIIKAKLREIRAALAGAPPPR